MYEFFEKLKWGDFWSEKFVANLVLVQPVCHEFLKNRIFGTTGFPNRSGIDLAVIDHNIMEGSVPWNAALSKILVYLSYCRTNQWDAATMLEICFFLVVRFFKIKQQFFSNPTWAGINQLQEFCSLERLVMVAGSNFLLWKLSHIFGEYIHPWNADELPNI